MAWIGTSPSHNIQLHPPSCMIAILSNETFSPVSRSGRPPSSLQRNASIKQSKCLDACQPFSPYGPFPLAGRKKLWNSKQSQIKYTTPGDRFKFQEIYPIFTQQRYCRWLLGGKAESTFSARGASVLDSSSSCGSARSDWRTVWRAAPSTRAAICCPTAPLRAAWDCNRDWKHERYNM